MSYDLKQHKRDILHEIQTLSQKDFNADLIPSILDNTFFRSSLITIHNIITDSSRVDISKILYYLEHTKNTDIPIQYSRYLYSLVKISKEIKEYEVERLYVEERELDIYTITGMYSDISNPVVISADPWGTFIALYRKFCKELNTAIVQQERDFVQQDILPLMHKLRLSHNKIGADT